ncbi:MAG: anchored repeat-type ABC transporter ATP-binding subunit [Actinomycetota bacterium]
MTTTAPSGVLPLEVHDLLVRLADRPVLDGVNLRAAPGELIGLIGPNGAGKTTLLRSILGLVPVASGHVEVFGQSPVQARQLVGYVPQRHEFAWDFPINVERAVLSGRVRMIGLLRKPNHSDREAVRDAVHAVGLDALRNRPVGQLSGGQRQRVLVARALAVRPRLLLLDEPFTGLDTATQEALSEVMTGFVRSGDDGTAAVLTTHDLPAAVLLCSRLCLVNRRVVADGPPAQLQEADVWMETFGVPSPRQLGIHRTATPTAPSMGSVR